MSRFLAATLSDDMPSAPSFVPPIVLEDAVVQSNTDMWAQISDSDDEVDPLVSKRRACTPQLRDAIRLLYKQIRSADHTVQIAMAKAFPVIGQCIDSKRAVVGTVSGLLRIEVNTIRTLLRKPQKSKRPSKRVTSQLLAQNRVDGASQSEARPLDDPSMIADISHSQQVFCTLSRVALSIGCSSKSLEHFPHECLRLKANGVEVGDKYHYGAFARSCIHSAAGLLDKMLLSPSGLGGLVPGIGIPSDVELPCDGVSVGKTKAHPQGRISLYITGVIWTTLLGNSQAAMFDARSHGVSATGADTAAMMLKTLMSAGFSKDTIRARLATVPGDGALCGGGPTAKHSSTRACEKFGLLIGRSDDVARWDDMHVVNHCVGKILYNVEWVTDMFDTLVQVRNVFGAGQGLELAAGVVEFIRGQGSPKSRFLAPRAPCATRMVVYLSSIPERLVRMLPWLIPSIGLRARHAQLKRTSHTIEFYRELGRQCADCTTLVHAMGLGWLLTHCVAPYVRLVQHVGVPPWVKWRAAKNARSRLEKYHTQLLKMGDFVNILFHLRPFLVCDCVFFANGRRETWNTWIRRPLSERFGGLFVIQRKYSGSLCMAFHICMFGALGTISKCGHGKLWCF